MLCQAGETAPKHGAAHIKLNVPSETTVLERAQGPRWVIAATGVLHFVGETIVITDEFEGRLFEVEKVAHAPVGQEELVKLHRRIDELEQITKRAGLT